MSMKYQNIAKDWELKTIGIRTKLTSKSGSNSDLHTKTNLIIDNVQNNILGIYGAGGTFSVSCHIHINLSIYAFFIYVSIIDYLFLNWLEVCIKQSSAINYSFCLKLSWNFTNRYFVSTLPCVIRK